MARFLALVLATFILSGKLSTPLARVLDAAKLEVDTENFTNTETDSENSRDYLASGEGYLDSSDDLHYSGDSYSHSYNISKDREDSEGIIKSRVKFDGVGISSKERRRDDMENSKQDKNGSKENASSVKIDHSYETNISTKTEASTTNYNSTNTNDSPITDDQLETEEWADNTDLAEPNGSTGVNWSTETNNSNSTDISEKTGSSNYANFNSSMGYIEISNMSKSRKNSDDSLQENESTVNSEVKSNLSKSLNGDEDNSENNVKHHEDDKEKEDGVVDEEKEYYEYDVDSNESLRSYLSNMPIEGHKLLSINESEEHSQDMSVEEEELRKLEEVMKSEEETEESDSEKNGSSRNGQKLEWQESTEKSKDNLTNWSRSNRSMEDEKLLVVTESVENSLDISTREEELNKSENTMESNENEEEETENGESKRKGSSRYGKNLEWQDSTEESSENLTNRSRKSREIGGSMEYSTELESFNVAPNRILARHILRNAKPTQDAVYLRPEDINLNTHPKHLILDLSKSGKSNAEKWSSSKRPCDLLPSKSNGLSAITILMDALMPQESAAKNGGSQTSGINTLRPFDIKTINSPDIKILQGIPELILSGITGNSVWTPTKDSHVDFPKYPRHENCFIFPAAELIHIIPDDILSDLPYSPDGIYLVFGEDEIYTTNELLRDPGNSFLLSNISAHYLKICSFLTENELLMALSSRMGNLLHPTTESPNETTYIDSEDTNVPTDIDYITTNTVPSIQQYTYEKDQYATSSKYLDTPGKFSNEGEDLVVDSKSEVDQVGKLGHARNQYGRPRYLNGKIGFSDNWYEAPNDQIERNWITSHNIENGVIINKDHSSSSGLVREPTYIDKQPYQVQYPRDYPVRYIWPKEQLPHYDDNINEPEKYGNYPHQYVEPYRFVDAHDNKPVFEFGDDYIKPIDPNDMTHQMRPLWSGESSTDQDIINFDDYPDYNYNYYDNIEPSYGVDVPTLPYDPKHSVGKINENQYKVLSMPKNINANHIIRVNHDNGRYTNPDYSRGWPVQGLGRPVAIPPQYPEAKLAGIPLPIQSLNSPVSPRKSQLQKRFMDSSGIMRVVFPQAGYKNSDDSWQKYPGWKVWHGVQETFQALNYKRCPCNHSNMVRRNSESEISYNALDGYEFSGNSSAKDMMVDISFGKVDTLNKDFSKTGHEKVQQDGLADVELDTYENSVIRGFPHLHSNDNAKSSPVFETGNHHSFSVESEHVTRTNINNSLTLNDTINDLNLNSTYIKHDNKMISDTHTYNQMDKIKGKRINHIKSANSSILELGTPEQDHGSLENSTDNLMEVHPIVQGGHYISHDSIKNLTNDFGDAVYTTHDLVVEENLDIDILNGTETNNITQTKDTKNLQKDSISIHDESSGTSENKLESAIHNNSQHLDDLNGHNISINQDKHDNNILTSSIEDENNNSSGKYMIVWVDESKNLTSEELNFTGQQSPENLYGTLTAQDFENDLNDDSISQTSTIPNISTEEKIHGVQGDFASSHENAHHFVQNEFDLIHMGKYNMSNEFENNITGDYTTHSLNDNRNLNVNAFSDIEPLKVMQTNDFEMVQNGGSSMHGESYRTSIVETNSTNDMNDIYLDNFNENNISMSQDQQTSTLTTSSVEGNANNHSGKYMVVWVDESEELNTEVNNNTEKSIVGQYSNIGHNNSTDSVSSSHYINIADQSSSQKQQIIQNTNTLDRNSAEYKASGPMGRYKMVWVEEPIDTGNTNIHNEQASTVTQYTINNPQNFEGTMKYSNGLNGDYKNHIVSGSENYIGLDSLTLQDFGGNVREEESNGSDKLVEGTIERNIEQTGTIESESSSQFSTITEQRASQIQQSTQTTSALESNNIENNATGPMGKYMMVWVDEPLDSENTDVIQNDVTSTVTQYTTNNPQDFGGTMNIYNKFNGHNKNQLINDNNNANYLGWDSLRLQNFGGTVSKEESNGSEKFVEGTMERNLGEYSSSANENRSQLSSISEHSTSQIQQNIQSVSTLGNLNIENKASGPMGRYKMVWVEEPLNSASTDILHNEQISTGNQFSANTPQEFEGAMKFSSEFNGDYKTNMVNDIDNYMGLDSISLQNGGTVKNEDLNGLQKWVEGSMEKNTDYNSGSESDGISHINSINKQINSQNQQSVKSTSTLGSTSIENIANGPMGKYMMVWTDEPLDSGSTSIVHNKQTSNVNQYSINNTQEFDDTNKFSSELNGNYKNHMVSDNGNFSGLNSPMLQNLGGLTSEENSYGSEKWIEGRMGYNIGQKSATESESSTHLSSITEQSTSQIQQNGQSVSTLGNLNIENKASGPTGRYNMVWVEEPLDSASIDILHNEQISTGNQFSAKTPQEFEGAMKFSSEFNGDYKTHMVNDIENYMGLDSISLQNGGTVKNEDLNGLQKWVEGTMEKNTDHYSGSESDGISHINIINKQINSQNQESVKSTSTLGSTSIENIANGPMGKYMMVWTDEPLDSGSTSILHNKQTSNVNQYSINNPQEFDDTIQFSSELNGDYKNHMVSDNGNFSGLNSLMLQNLGGLTSEENSYSSEKWTGVMGNNIGQKSATESESSTHLSSITEQSTSQIQQNAQSTSTLESKDLVNTASGPNGKYMMVWVDDSQEAGNTDLINNQQTTTITEYSNTNPLEFASYATGDINNYDMESYPPALVQYGTAPESIGYVSDGTRYINSYSSPMINDNPIYNVKRDIGGIAEPSWTGFTTDDSYNPYRLNDLNKENSNIEMVPMTDDLNRDVPVKYLVPKIGGLQFSSRLRRAVTPGSAMLNSGTHDKNGLTTFSEVMPKS